MKSPRLALGALGLVALVAIGCPAADESKTDQSKTGAPAAPIEVAVTRAAPRDVAREVALPVELWAWQRVAIVAKVTGYLSEVRVDRGSVVKAGDVLLVVATPELEDERRRRTKDLDVIAAEVSSALASHELQALTAKRLEALVTDNAATTQEVDEARAKEVVTLAAIAQARARLAAALEAVRATETWLAYATIRAPFDGVISERSVHPGALVSAQERTPLLELVDRATIRAVIDVPEAEAPRIRSGETAATVTIPELGARGARPGVVSRIADSLDPRTRTLRIEVDLENARRDLVPGMFGQGALVVEKHAGVLALPSSAIARGGSEAAVFVVQEGHARRTGVKLGLDDGKIVEIVSGVSPDALVAVTARGLTDGAAVKVLEPAKEPR